MPLKMRRPLQAVALTAAALAAYSFYEPHRYRLVRRELRGLEGAGRLTVLHLSDLHASRRTTGTIRFLESIPALLGQIPDVIALTGDLIEDDTGIDPVLRALASMDARYGKFYVLGSHDYYQSERPSYLKYFDPKRKPISAPRANTERLEAGLQEAGWNSVMNTGHGFDVDGGWVVIAGVDDPYLDRHTTDHIARPAGARVAIGLVHAPDVVSEWALHGFDLVLAGHTHAGQVRIPGIRAVVTNCSLPSGLAGGVHPVGRTWLHVSPGLGTGRFAPIRFGVRPEATLITLSD
jgi:predicted MPP superfamily phosphohydrolase